VHENRAEQYGLIMDDQRPADVHRITGPALVVLIGPSGSGKSAWAAQHFADSEVVSSDRLRAVAGTSESDLAASDDAFVLLRQVVMMRCHRRLTTVVDTLGFDADLRLWLIAVGEEHGIAVHAVLFDTPSRLCRERNAKRPKRVPAAVLTTQFKTFVSVRAAVLVEPFTSVRLVTADEPVDQQAAPLADHRPQTPTAAPEPGWRTVRFGLQISAFPGPASTLRTRLAQWATAAEEAGFDSIWVMDHFRQIPQIGREWDDMPESIATLSFLAAHTQRVTLGSLVHCVTHRNIGVLGKSLATLDVMSGGRAVCGLGLGWFAAEHADYSLEFPSVNDRYALLEDALQFLPFLWGKGSPSYSGQIFSSPKALGYPRPLQARIPILVGGGGERRTLKLAAKYADACNLFGAPEVVERKVRVLRQHCDDVGRDFSAISVTHLGPALVGISAQDLAARVEGIRAPARAVASMNPGTIEEHADRLSLLVDSGVDHLIVSLPDVSEEAITRFGRVIASVRSKRD
jgi:alkanesulfonate monooxygenase SsuD/methylene tetrahydromethanopterin reductase-like flavin-dependent oxidoreductase (luciferase family)/predicted kinase